MEDLVLAWFKIVWWHLRYAERIPLKASCVTSLERHTYSRYCFDSTFYVNEAFLVWYNWYDLPVNYQTK